MQIIILCKNYFIFLKFVYSNMRSYLYKAWLAVTAIKKKTYRTCTGLMELPSSKTGLSMEYVVGGGDFDFLIFVNRRIKETHLSFFSFCCSSKVYMYVSFIYLSLCNKKTNIIYYRKISLYLFCVFRRRNRCGRRR